MKRVRSERRSGRKKREGGVVKQFTLQRRTGAQSGVETGRRKHTAAETRGTRQLRVYRCEAPGVPSVTASTALQLPQLLQVSSSC